MTIRKKDQSAIEAIVKHRAVTTAMLPHSRGYLEKLIRLRHARGGVKRAARNMREEISVGRQSYEEGGIVEVQRMPGDRLLREALEAGGLPDDLAQMIREYLAR